MYKTLDECKKCECFKGMDESLVLCAYEGINRYVPCMPSNWIAGFKNGTKVVRCPKFREKKNKRINARNKDGKFTVDI